MRFIISDCLFVFTFIMNDNRYIYSGMQDKQNNYVEWHQWKNKTVVWINIFTFKSFPAFRQWGGGFTKFGSLCLCVVLCTTSLYMIDISKGTGASSIRFNIKMPIIAKRRFLLILSLALFVAVFKLVEDALCKCRYVTSNVDT